MDRHAQQIKRERQDKARSVTNSNNKSKMHTLIKKVLATKDQKKAEGFYKETVSFIDKMAARKLIPKKTAGRRKALITRHLNSITK
jgi:ribosomal protein S20